MFNAKVCMCAVYPRRMIMTSLSDTRCILYHDRLVIILLALAGHGGRKNNSLIHKFSYPSSRYSGSFSSIIFNIYTSSDVAYVGASSKMGSLVHSVENNAL